MKDPFSADLVAQPVVRKLLEKDVQSRCVAYARSKGYWARKFSSPSQRSVPDFLFGKRFPFKEIMFGGKYFDSDLKWAEEFKAPDKKPTENQEDEQKLMRDAGWIVFPDTGRLGQADIDAFKARIDALEDKYS